MKTILILLAMTGAAMAQNMSGMGRIADDNSCTTQRCIDNVKRTPTMETHHD